MQVMRVPKGGWFGSNVFVEKGDIYKTHTSEGMRVADNIDDKPVNVPIIFKDALKNCSGARGTNKIKKWGVILT